MAVMIKPRHLTNIGLTAKPPSSNKIDLPGETPGGYYNHVYRLNRVLQNMSNRGIPVDNDKLDQMASDLAKEREKLLLLIQDLIRERSEEKEDKMFSYGENDVYLTLPKVLREWCKAAGEVKVENKRKKNKETGKYEMRDVEVSYPFNPFKNEMSYGTASMKEIDQVFINYSLDEGFEWIERHEGDALVARIVAARKFNPESPQQVMLYCKWMGYEIPTAMKKTPSGKEEKETTDDEALEELWKKTKDPLFQLIQDIRGNNKLAKTYVLGWRPNRTDGRLHSTYTFRPATGQLSSTAPNVQNPHPIIKTAVVADAGKVLVECVSPETKVLLADLSWIDAEKVKAGDEVIGFDENLVGKNRRYFRKGIVMDTNRFVSNRRYKIVTDQGDITVSATHKFLVRRSNKSQWVMAKDLREGESLAFFTKPWEKVVTYEGGWLAGFLDGEGYIDSTGLGFGQNPGVCSSKAQTIFAKHGFVLSKDSKQTCEKFMVLAGESRIPFASIRAIGMFRPVRLLAKIQNKLEGMATWGKATKPATILSIKKTPKGDVIAIKTTTSTLITNGFLSHNCDYSGYHAQLLGYFAGSQEYMKLATLGLHDYLAAHILRARIGNMKPTEFAQNKELWTETVQQLITLDSWLSLPDLELAGKLSWIKKHHKEVRNKQAKPAVHGIGFGMGVKKLYDMNKGSFANLKEAESIRNIMVRLFPSVFKFQAMIVEKAHKDKKLISPYGFVRRFWEAKIYRNGQMVNGEDAEKIIAFLPANTAFSIKKEAMLRLESIGANHKYCLVNEVHDSLVYEVREGDLEEMMEVVKGEMTRPVMKLANEMFPEGFVPVVEIKVGQSWDKMEVL